MHGSTPTDGYSPTPGARINIPDVIPIFPLPNVVLLPGEVLPLHIFEPRYREMTRDALDQHRVIGMIEYAGEDSAPDTGEQAVRDVGCAGFIAEHQELPDGRFLLWLLGLERFRVIQEISTDTPYRRVRVAFTPIEENAASTAGMHPVRTELQQTLPRLVDLDQESRTKLRSQILEISDSQLIALASQILELPAERKRRLLEADTQVERLVLICEDLYRHLDGNLDLEGDDSEILN